VSAMLVALVDGGALARPDAVVCSGAARARATAGVLAAALGTGPPAVEGALYRADADDLLAWARQLPDDAATVAVVGHNPAVSDLVDLLAGPDAAAPGMGTATVAVVHLAVPRWAAVAAGDGRLLRLLRP
jgi:phosphohistidine phosphatase